MTLFLYHHELCHYNQPDGQSGVESASGHQSTSASSANGAGGGVSSMRCRKVGGAGVAACCSRRCLGGFQVVPP